MLIIENIKIAFGALLSGKMRSLLTMLGIIIGIGSVIAIMTVSSSLSSSISDSFQEMGANNITTGLRKLEQEESVKANGMKFGAVAGNSNIEEKDLVTDEMLVGLRQEFQDKIDAIAISENTGSGTAMKGNASANISINGINDEYFASSKTTLLAGRRINASDIKGNKKVIMVSDKLAESLFNGSNESALAQKIVVYSNGKYEDFYIIGVYKYEENTFSSDSSSNITTTAYIPLSVAKELVHSDKGYSQFTVVTSKDIEDVSLFAEEIEQYFQPYYTGNQDYGISTSTMQSMTESMYSMISTVSVAVSFIAGISLLVGGIGVMNIMMVSITERTREIGTRKALGAKNSSIRLQFITESVILCLLGGILGIITGFILGAIAAHILGYGAAVPLGSIVISVGFSMAIGVFFGYYPANKAAQMNPAEALRYE